MALHAPPQLLRRGSPLVGHLDNCLLDLMGLGDGFCTDFHHSSRPIRVRRSSPGEEVPIEPRVPGLLPADECLRALVRQIRVNDPARRPRE